MGVLDIVIIVFILFFGIRGIANGLINQVISILGIILAILFSYMLYEPLFKLMHALGLGKQGSSIGAYILGFIIIYVIVIILGNLIHNTLIYIHLGWVNKGLGFFFGILQGAVIASVILWIIVSILPKDIKLVKDIKSSQTAQITLKVVPYLYDRVSSISNIERYNPFK